MSCTNQRLQIRINQNIPSSIRTHTSLYTTMPSSYSSTSTIGRHLFANQNCTCVFTTKCESYWRHQQMIWSYPLWTHYLLKKYKPALCIQKQSSTPLLFNNLLRPSEENIINRTNSAGLQKFFFRYVFLHQSRIFLCLQSHAYFLFYKIDCHWQFSEEIWPKERVLFVKILIRFYDFKTFIIPCTRIL